MGAAFTAEETLVLAGLWRCSSRRTYHGPVDPDAIVSVDFLPYPLIQAIVFARDLLPILEQRFLRVPILIFSTSWRRSLPLSHAFIRLVNNRTYGIGGYRAATGRAKPDST